MSFMGRFFVSMYTFRDLARETEAVHWVTCPAAATGPPSLTTVG